MSGQFLCWNCGLRYGEEGALELPSQLCEACQAARSPQVRVPDEGDNEDNFQDVGELEES